MICKIMLWILNVEVERVRDNLGEVREGVQKYRLFRIVKIWVILFGGYSYISCV